MFIVITPLWLAGGCFVYCTCATYIYTRLLGTAGTIKTWDDIEEHIERAYLTVVRCTIRPPATARRFLSHAQKQPVSWSSYHDA
ncbi:uncharacterized protein B0H18DRAFT_418128 [Fomitopsis serialis]|uniref:uncharacterized protein n=1 Tax=Fomitopsis serialis TaxID=139415 RepID=UPI002008DC59|nr:uncharacterized protein B0H18DRAFT_418128 [Neoantrodia serialis]KAH9935602.1 hypothetical protein B0H18DRAFT_418128 [Neoantrodia serialis]